MGDMAVYKRTTADDDYFRDDDEISNIHLIPPSSKRSSECGQRVCIVILVICIVMLITGVVVLGVMVDQLQTDMNVLRGANSEQTIASNTALLESLHNKTQQNTNQTNENFQVKIHEFEEVIQGRLAALNRSVYEATAKMSIKNNESAQTLALQIQTAENRTKEEFIQMVKSSENRTAAKLRTEITTELHLLQNNISHISEETYAYVSNKTEQSQSLMENYTAAQMASQNLTTLLYIDSQVANTTSMIEYEIQTLNSSLSNGFEEKFTTFGGELKSADQRMQDIISQLNALRDMMSSQYCTRCTQSLPCRTGELARSPIENCITGYIVTDGYPHSNYSHHSDQSWAIVNPGFDNLNITFIDFQLEGRNSTGLPSNDCEYDKLIIGSSSYCGHIPPNNQNVTLQDSQRRPVNMRFATDGSVAKRGFKIKFTFF